MSRFRKILEELRAISEKPIPLVVFGTRHARREIGPEPHEMAVDDSCIEEMRSMAIEMLNYPSSEVVLIGPCRLNHALPGFYFANVFFFGSSKTEDLFQKIRLDLPPILSLFPPETPDRRIAHSMTYSRIERVGKEMKQLVRFRDVTGELQRHHTAVIDFLHDSELYLPPTGKLEEYPKHAKKRASATVDEGNDTEISNRPDESTASLELSENEKVSGNEASQQPGKDSGSEIAPDDKEELASETAQQEREKAEKRAAPEEKESDSDIALMPLLDNWGADDRKHTYFFHLATTDLVSAIENVIPRLPKLIPLESKEEEKWPAPLPEHPSEWRKRTRLSDIPPCDIETQILENEKYPHNGDLERDRWLFWTWQCGKYQEIPIILAALKRHYTIGRMSLKKYREIREQSKGLAITKLGNIRATAKRYRDRYADHFGLQPR